MLCTFIERMEYYRLNSSPSLHKENYQQLLLSPLTFRFITRIVGLTLTAAATSTITNTSLFFLILLFYYLPVSVSFSLSLSFSLKAGGGAIAHSVERATPVKEVLGSIPAVAACSLLFGLVSV